MINKRKFISKIITMAIILLVPEFQPAYSASLFSVENVVQIEVGDGTACALEKDSDIWCWGYLPINQFNAIPAKLEPSLSNVKQIAVGADFICALRENGEIFCWSVNRGNGILHSDEFFKVINLPSITSISASDFFMCAVSLQKEVWCMGEFGRDAYLQNSSAGIYEPYKVPFSADVNSIELGTNGICALLASERVSCLGILIEGRKTAWAEVELTDICNNDNYLCSGIAVSRVNPLEVSGLSEVIELRFGTESTCALTRQKHVYCWGMMGNLGKQISNGTIREIPLPGKPIKLFNSGGRDEATTSCAELESHEIYCWGRDIKYASEFNWRHWENPKHTPLLNNAEQIVFGKSGFCALFNFAIRCMGDSIRGSSESSIAYNTFGFVTGTLNAPAPPLDLSSSISTANSISLEWSEPPSFGFESERTGYEIAWSRDEVNWNYLQTDFSTHEYTINGLNKGSGYYVKVRTLDTDRQGIFDTPIEVFTTGITSQLVTIVDENGKPLSGGSVNWKSADDRFSGTKAYGLTNTGQLNFGSAIAGDSVVSLMNVNMANGVEITGEFETTFGFGPVTIEVPLDTWAHEWSVKAQLPNGKNAVGIKVESNLNSEHQVNGIMYSLDTPVIYGLTDNLGEIKLYGFHLAPSATVRLDDGELLQSETVSLENAINIVTFQEMPWMETATKRLTTKKGALVDIKVISSDFVPLNARLAMNLSIYSSAGKVVKVIPPAGAVQKCKGRRLSSKISDNGTATLKICATKSGAYSLQSKGIVSTSSIDIRVKGLPATQVRNIEAFSPEAGAATISWDPPAYTGGSKILNYKVTLNGKKTLTKEVKKTFIRFGNLDNAKTYSITIQAVTKNGESDPSYFKVDVA